MNKILKEKIDVNCVYAICVLQSHQTVFTNYIYVWRSPQLLSVRCRQSQLLTVRWRQVSCSQPDDKSASHSQMQTSQFFTVTDKLAFHREMQTSQPLAVRCRQVIISQPNGSQAKQQSEPAEDSKRRSEAGRRSIQWCDVNAHVQSGVSKENKATTEGSLHEYIHLVFHWNKSTVEKIQKWMS